MSTSVRPVLSIPVQIGPPRPDLLPCLEPFELPSPRALVNHIEELLRTLRWSTCELFSMHQGQFTAASGSDIDQQTWDFITQVLHLLPVSFLPENILNSRLNIYQTLYHAESARPIQIREFVNPAAEMPEPAMLEKASGDPEAVEITTRIEGNPYVDYEFHLIQNALTGTDVVDYVVEFEPDLNPGSIEENDTSSEVEMEIEMQLGGADPDERNHHSEPEDAKSRSTSPTAVASPSDGASAKSTSQPQHPRKPSSRSSPAREQAAKAAAQRARAQARASPPARRSPSATPPVPEEAGAATPLGSVREELGEAPAVEKVLSP
ncbi:unnamed protein product [Mycena citricolor]|uniref:Uncharacterized protein n=1 Tax=Mycena citricolor TaxID=2018698 RepID=A0AAD2GZR2_9AGAR|nr:unnamed protein product [Mycena citricolor]CAK5281276.1 unnamed protein product [Mycena citricolor]